MINKKAELGLKGWFLALIIFSFVVVSCLFLLTDASVNYDLNIATPEFNETYNQIDATYNLSQDIKGDMLDSDIEGGAQSWDSSVKSSYTTARRVRSTFTLAGTIMNEISKQIGIPTYIITFALSAIVIILMFAMIKLFLGRGGN